jgi:hypothetical protein
VSTKKIGDIVQVSALQEHVQHKRMSVWKINLEKDLTERAYFRLVSDTEHMILVRIQMIMEELAGVLLILITKADVGDTARYLVHCLNLTPAMEYRVSF